MISMYMIYMGWLNNRLNTISIIGQSLQWKSHIGVMLYSGNIYEYSLYIFFNAFG